MARRRLADERTSRLAIWARRCAFFSLAATVLAILIVRSGMLEVVPALATFAGALLFSVIGIVLAFGAFVVIWKDGTDGIGHALAAIAIGAGLIAYPAYLGVRAYRLPMINDITTDPIDPPRFIELAKLRPRGTVEYAGLYAADQQQRAYPDIQPLSVAATPEVAYDEAIKVITKRKWRVYESQRPQANQRDGQIEAVARTAIMGFRDDVVLRVRPTADGVVIDVRSASRYGRHDFGANAARIRSLIADLEDAIDLRSDDRRRPPAQKPAPAAKPQPAKR